MSKSKSPFLLEPWKLRAPAFAITDSLYYVGNTNVSCHLLKTDGGIVLIDTAGRMQTDVNLMNELGKIKRVINPDLTILTVDALTGNDAVFQAEEFHKNIGIDGTILTKVDADIKGGSALSVSYVTGKPILFVGTGQDYKDLQNFNPELFTQIILG